MFILKGINQLENAIQKQRKFALLLNSTASDVIAFREAKADFTRLFARNPIMVTKQSNAPAKALNAACLAITPLL
jgi:hypothetical protein